MKPIHLSCQRQGRIIHTRSTFLMSTCMGTFSWPAVIRFKSSLSPPDLPPLYHPYLQMVPFSHLQIWRTTTFESSTIIQVQFITTVKILQLDNYQSLLGWIFQPGKFLWEKATLWITSKFWNSSSKKIIHLFQKTSNGTEFRIVLSSCVLRGPWKPFAFPFSSTI